MAKKKMATKAKKSGSNKRPFVVVRTYSAGVHFGELVSRAGQEVKLVNARRLWMWRGANTLHEVAMSGVSSGSRVSVVVPEIDLTQAIEIIVASEMARANLTAATWSA
jgi:hypothetical protein